MPHKDQARGAIAPEAMELDLAPILILQDESGQGLIRSCCCADLCHQGDFAKS
jgi:hypothetical protein